VLSAGADSASLSAWRLVGMRRAGDASVAHPDHVPAL